MRCNRSEHRSNRHCAAALLALVGCAQAKVSSPPGDVISVTELAARYALEHDVPAVLRNGSVVCLVVDGQAPAPEVLSRLSSGGEQVWSGASACSGPRAVVLEVSSVEVSGETARARAGVRLGSSGVLDFRSFNGQWRLLASHGDAGAGPVLTFPLPR